MNEFDGPDFPEFEEMTEEEQKSLDEMFASLTPEELVLIPF